MAFTQSTWSDVGGIAKRGAAPQVFSYTTTDASSAVLVAGYFNAMQPFLLPGDVILISGFLAATPYVAHYVVSVSTVAAGVTVVKMSSLVPA